MPDQQRPWFQDWRAAVFAAAVVGFAAIALMFPLADRRADWAYPKEAYDAVLPTLQSAFPDEVAAFTQAYMGTPQHPATPETINAWADDFTKRHWRDLQRAPADHLAKFVQIERERSRTIAAVDVKYCARNISGDPLWGHYDTDTQGLIHFFETVRLGRDEPQTYGQPTDEDNKQLAAWTKDPAVIKSAADTVSNFHWPRSDIEECEKKLIIIDAMSRLAPTAVARMLQDIERK